MPRLISTPFSSCFSVNQLSEWIQSQNLHESDCMSAPNYIYIEFWKAMQCNCRHKCNVTVYCCLFCSEAPRLSVELTFGVQPFVVVPWFMRESKGGSPYQMSEYKCCTALSGPPNSFSINFIPLLTNSTVSSSWRRCENLFNLHSTK